MAWGGDLTFFINLLSNSLPKGKSQSTVEPPVSNHPKYKDCVVAYGRLSLIRIKPQESLSARGPKTSAFW